MQLVSRLFSDNWIWALGLAGLTVAQPSWADQYPSEFNRGIEFPNYFADVPKSEVEAAMGSVLARIAVPTFTQDRSEIQLAPLFQMMDSEMLLLRTEGITTADARLMPSAGVVRSTLSFLYASVREGLERNQSPRETLRQIAFHAEPIPAHRVLSVGGDIDVLILGAGEKTIEIIIDRLKKSFHRVEGRLGLTDSRSPLKWSLLPILDLHDYESQIGRATRQGGSTLDYLAFDRASGRVLSPPHLPDVWENILKGIIAYLPPSAGEKASEKQTFRGMRSLMEAPWLRYDSTETLEKELEAILGRVKAGETVSDQALLQVAKMVRNARFGGAHNRFYRATEGADALFFEIMEEIRAKTNNTYLPEFVQQRELISRRPGERDLNGLPGELLVPETEFHGRTIYHGTVELLYALAILRGQLFVSDGVRNQTIANLGKGAYLSIEEAYAASRAGPKGVVIPYEIRSDRIVNVLDWELAAESDFVRKLRKRVKTDAEMFDVLCFQHGIDVLKDGDVFRVLNGSALEHKGSVGKLVTAVGTRLLSAPTLSGFQEFLRLFALAELAGEPMDKSLILEAARMVLNEETMADRRLKVDLRELATYGDHIPLEIRREIFELGLRLVERHQTLYGTGAFFSTFGISQDFEQSAKNAESVFSLDLAASAKQEYARKLFRRFPERIGEVAKVLSRADALVAHRAFEDLNTEFRVRDAVGVLATKEQRDSFLAFLIRGVPFVPIENNFSGEYQDYHRNAIDWIEAIWFDRPAERADALGALLRGASETMFDERNNMFVRQRAGFKRLLRRVATGGFSAAELASIYHPTIQHFRDVLTQTRPTHMPRFVGSGWVLVEMSQRFRTQTAGNTEGASKLRSLARQHAELLLQASLFGYHDGPYESDTEACFEAMRTMLSKSEFSEFLEWYERAALAKKTEMNARRPRALGSAYDETIRDRIEAEKTLVAGGCSAIFL